MTLLSRERGCFWGRILILGLLTCWFVPFWCWAATPVRIGVLQDGLFWEHEPILEAVKKELEVLTTDKYELLFPAERQIAGQFSLEKIHKAVELLAQDTSLDLIISLGPVSSQVFAQTIPLPVPVVAINVFAPAAQGLLQPDSWKPINENWTTSYDPSIFSAFVELSRSVLDFENATFLCSEFHCGTATKISQVLETWGAQAGFSLKTMVISPDNFSQQLSLLKSDLIFVDMLYGFSEFQVQQVFADLTERKLPSLTAQGIYGVELGALMSAAWTDYQALGRTYALKINMILDGISPKDIPVLDDWKLDLSFNLDTARSIGFDIPWRFYYESHLVEQGKYRKSLTLQQAVEIGLQANHQILIDHAARAQTTLQRKKGESALFPQVQTQLRHTRINQERADLSPSPRAETVFELSIGQNIWNPELKYILELADKLEEIATYQTQILQEDLQEQIILAYLDLLLREELVKVQREHLRTYSRLKDIAELRYNLQETTKSDVLRVEIQYENAHLEMTSAFESRHQAKIHLNHLLNFPKEELLSLDAMHFSRDNLEDNQRFLQKYYTNRHIRLIRDFLTEQMWQHSIALQVANSQLQQVRLQKAQIESQFWPKFEAGASWYSQLQDEHRDFVNTNSRNEEDIYEDQFQDGWNFQITMSVPLYTGGLRFTELEEAKARIEEIVLTREKLKSDLAAQARTLQFTHFSNSNRANNAENLVEKAHENFELGKVAYLQGSIPIMDLMDLQSNVILSEINATVARFQTYQSLTKLLRLVGKLDFMYVSTEDAGVQAFLQKLDQYVTSRIQ